MGFFKKVEGSAAIIVSNGVYKQVDVFERDGFLFCASSGGFIRLMHDGSTSKAKTTLNFMAWDGPLYRSRTGTLCTEAANQNNRIPLAEEKKQLLIGAPEENLS